MRTFGTAFYTAEQVEAWAGYPDEGDDFAKRLKRGNTLVAEQAGEVLAFGQLEPTDHLAFLYCRGSHGRRGIATALYQALESLAIESGQIYLDTAASRVSRPLFEKQGLRVVEREEPVRRGIRFERFRMARLLFEPQATRWVILGNSASGKTTLARRIAELTGASVLDLDRVAWDPSAATPTRRDLAASDAEIDCFVREHPSWVIEGCYEDLIGAVAERWDPVMVFLDPEVKTCLDRARRREFEPHKFANPEAQDEVLGFLLKWIEEYSTRSGAMSRASHLRCFESYPGKKLRVV